MDGKGVPCIQRTRLTLKDLDYLFKILMTKIIMTKTNLGWCRKKIWKKKLGVIHIGCGTKKTRSGGDGKKGKKKALEMTEKRQKTRSRGDR